MGLAVFYGIFAFVLFALMNIPRIIEKHNCKLCNHGGNIPTYSGFTPPPMPKCVPPKDYKPSDLDKYFDYQCENTLEIDPFPNNEKILKMGNSMKLEAQAINEINSKFTEKSSGEPALISPVFKSTC